MKRRQFLGALGAGVLNVEGSINPVITLPGNRQAHDFKLWTWVHGGRRSEASWNARFARISAAGMHGVLVSGGDTDAISHAARDNGLEFHRWTWILNRPGDSWVQEYHPDWYSVSRNGDSCLERPPYVNYYKWLCPTRPEVREYLTGVVGEIASSPGVVGVHLDYIRHPDVILPVGLWSQYDLVQDREYAEFDFCYCECCRATFEAKSGKDPLELSDPTMDEEWREFRWNSVTGVVKAVAQAIRVQGKQVTAAVFPTPTIARNLVRQEWDLWPIDGFFPMLYHQFYNEQLQWVGTATREGVAALPPGTPLFSGVYMPWLSPQDLIDVASSVHEAGAAGMSLFEVDRVTDEHIARLKEFVGG